MATVLQLLISNQPHRRKLVIKMGGAGREWQEFYSAMRFDALLLRRDRAMVAFGLCRTDPPAAFSNALLAENFRGAA